MSWRLHSTSVENLPLHGPGCISNFEISFVAGLAICNNILSDTVFSPRFFSHGTFHAFHIVTANLINSHLRENSKVSLK